MGGLVGAREEVDRDDEDTEEKTLEEYREDDVAKGELLTLDDSEEDTDDTTKLLTDDDAGEEENRDELLLTLDEAGLLLRLEDSRLLLTALLLSEEDPGEDDTADDGDVGGQTWKYRGEGAALLKNGTPGSALVKPDVMK